MERLLREHQRLKEKDRKLDELFREAVKKRTKSNKDLDEYIERNNLSIYSLNIAINGSQTCNQYVCLKNITEEISKIKLKDNMKKNKEEIDLKIKIKTCENYGNYMNIIDDDGSEEMKDLTLRLENDNKEIKKITDEMEICDTRIKEVCNKIDNYIKDNNLSTYKIYLVCKKNMGGVDYLNKYDEIKKVYTVSKEKALEYLRYNIDEKDWCSVKIEKCHASEICNDKYDSII